MTKRKRQIAKPTRYLGVKRLVGEPGLYEIRGTWTSLKTGKRKAFQRLIRAASDVEASKLRAEEIRNGMSRTAPVYMPRLLDCAKSWLADKKGEVEWTTHDRYRRDLSYMMAIIGDIYIDKLEIDDVAQCRTRLAEEFEPWTVNGTLQTFRGFMSDMVARYHLSYDVAAKVRYLKVRRKNKVLREADLRAFLTAFEKLYPDWYPLVLLLATTGMRWGAATALRFDDIRDGRITIERAHVSGREKGTKTDTVREVALAPELEQLLQARRERMIANQAPGIERGLVFANGAGNFVTSGTLTDHFRRAAEAAGLAKWDRDEQGRSKPGPNGKAVLLEGKNITPHWLRYTFNNYCRENAGSIVAQAIIGHATDKMTAHYSDVSFDEKRAVVLSFMERLGR